MSDRFAASSTTWPTTWRGTCPDRQTRDAFLRRAAATSRCRITFIAPDGRVLDDTDLLPADVPGMENHANRPEVRQAVEKGTGCSRRLSPTEQKQMLYVARRLPDGASCGWPSRRRGCGRSSSATSGRCARRSAASA